MNIKTLFLSVISAAVSASGLAQTAIETTPDGYTLRWSDEFNGTALNEKIWNIEVNGNGGGNQELQYYRRENVSVEDGNLVLTARRENFSGKAFTSGRVTTQNKAAFKHGILQARIKFPKTANGLWPAYWMMGNDMSKYGWPRCGEMDIIELGHFNGINAGTQDRYFGGTLHYGPDATNEHHQQLSQNYTAPETNPVTNDEYHIFTVEWDENNLYMYYDLEAYTPAKKRQARYFSTSITASDEEMSPGHYFQKPFFFLFNLAVGGSYTNIYDPAGISALPNAGDEAKMYVDWVRVYQADNDAEAQYTYIDENGDVQTNIEEEPEPEPEPDTKTELSGFATKALDDNGVSTFDFNDVSDAVLISTSQGVTGNLRAAGVNVTDYNVNDDNRNLYVWENTMVSVNRTGEINSFGWGEGYNKFTVASVGWSGLGFSIKNEDLSMIDDSYWLHFAMRGTDQELHTSHTVTIANAEFIVGKSDGKLASIGDFKRDGEWYYFDIPVKALKQFANPLLGDNPSAFDGNIVAFSSGSITDAELCFDNIFFYKSKTKEIPVYTDTSANLGKYGYKSLDENGSPVFSFDDVKEIVPLVLSGDTWESLTAGGTYGEDSMIKEEYDNSEQGGRNNFFVWGNPQTMTVSSVTDVPNSFGRVPYGGFSAYASALKPGWNGAGWASIDGQGNFPKPKDLSMIDDTYYLHLSLRSDAAVGHIPVMVRLGSKDEDASLVFGSYSDKAIFADFNRDGEWYSFDIPVAELKKYGKLWNEAAEKGGISAYTDYVLCIYTAPTYYTGSSFSIDNVFFYKTDKAPEVNELGEYTTKSLGSDGKSYFDFAGKDFINISGNGDVTEKMKTDGEESIVLDIRSGVNGAQFYNWTGNSYTEGTQSGSVPNSFGGNEGWMDFVTNGGWTGAGLVRKVSGTGVDFTILEEGDWYLHFAMRGTDLCNHQIGFAEAKFTIGSTAFGPGVPVLGNYKRDGEWYSYDIPYSVLKTLITEMFPSADGGQGNWTGNIIWFMSGGGSGDEIQIDNIFMWRDKDSTTAIEKPQADVTGANRVTGIFDISGRKVQNMSKPGLYIIRTADSVRKVIVK